MTSVPRALAWTMWRQHREGLRFQGTCLVALAIVTALLTRNPPGIPAQWADIAAPWILGVIGMLLSVPIMSAFVILNYGTEGTDLVARESCFPQRQFRLPVRTAWLAAWPIAVGAVVMASLWVGVAWFLLRPWVIVMALRQGLQGHDVPLWWPVPLLWPALLMMAMLAWSQAILWNPFGLPWLRIVAYMVLLTAGVLVGPVAYERFSEANHFGLLAGCTVMGWTAAYLGVHRARRGDTPDWRFLLAPVHGLLRRLSGPRTAFASASRAQFWMERRLGGYSLPFMMVLVTPFMLWPLFFLSFLDDPLSKKFSAKQFSLQYIVLALTLPIFFAGVFGASGGGGYSPGIKSRKTGLGSFLAGLPMTTSDMVAAMLRTVSFSTLLTWAWMVVTVALASAILLAYGPSEAPEWWRRALADVPAGKIAIGSAAAAVLAIVWTWKRQIDRLHFTLSGRVWVGTVMALSAVAMWFLLGVIVVVMIDDPPSRAIFAAVGPWVLGVVMVFRLIAACWVTREVVRREFVRRRTAVLGVVAWLLIAAALIGVLVWTVPAALVPTWYVVFAVLFALPMVRLPAVPLALDWNRHR